jgi:hypothetical protein
MAPTLSTTIQSGVADDLGDDLVVLLLRQPDERDAFSIDVDVGLPDRALPVIEVRHHRVVTDRADAACNIVKLIAHAPHVHEHDHRRERPILLGMRDERRHPPGLGRDLNDAVLHRSLPGAVAVHVGIG